MEPAAVYWKETDIVAQLWALNMSVEQLHRAIRFGQGERDECTKNDPRSFPGLIAWGKTTRGLREELHPSEYERFVDEQNYGYELVINRKLGVAIVVATGDEGAGCRDREPRTKNAKGDATLTVVSQNLCLFEDPEPKRRQTDYETWFLLLNRVDTDAENVVRSELSLPNYISEGGVIMGWAKRIILPEIEIDPRPTVKDIQYTDDIAPVITKKSTA